MFLASYIFAVLSLLFFSLYKAHDHNTFSLIRRFSVFILFILFEFFRVDAMWNISWMWFHLFEKKQN